MFIKFKVLDQIILGNLYGLFFIAFFITALACLPIAFINEKWKEIHSS